MINDHDNNEDLGNTVLATSPNDQVITHSSKMILAEANPYDSRQNRDTVKPQSSNNSAGATVNKPLKKLSSPYDRSQRISGGGGNSGSQR